MQVDTIWPGLSLPASPVRAGLPSPELAQKAPRVEADGGHVHVRACTLIHACVSVHSCLRAAVLLGCM